MKIAVPTKHDNQIDAHFGHCEFFKIFTISEQNEIVSEEIYTSPQSCGCKSSLAPELASSGVSLMLAGGIGDGAVNVLKFHNIAVVRNCAGDVNELVQAYLKGTVTDGGSNCSEHQHGHNCQH